MALITTAREAVQRAREYHEEFGPGAMTDASVLRMVDQALESILSQRALYGEDYEVDYDDIPLTSWTQVQDGWYEYQLPLKMAKVRQLEGLVGGNTSQPHILSAGEIHESYPVQVARGNGATTWQYTGPGYPGKISIVGNPDQYDTIRLWYLRRYPALSYSTSVASGQITSPGATSCALPASGTTGLIGTVAGVDDVYTGMLIAFETSNVIRPITGYTASTRTITYETATLAGAENWSLVVPLEPEFTDFLGLKTAYHMSARSGNANYRAALAQQVQHSESRFTEAISQRGAQKTRSVWKRRY